MLPPVSDPRDPTHSLEATDAAGPPLLPPGTFCRSQGFFTGPKAEFSLEEPMANSSILAFPIIIPPALIILVTTVALKVGV